MFKHIVTALALATIAGCSPAPEGPAQEPVAENRPITENRVVSILNAGIRAEFGEAKFLIDPLYDNHFGSLAEMGPELIEKIIAGEAPYDGVDAVFVSHAHADHFSAEYLNRMMAAQAEVIVVAPDQALAAMQASPIWQDEFQSRIVSIDLENGGPPQLFELAGAEIEALQTPHAGWPDRHKDTDNITYRISSEAGARIIHLGDADPVVEHFAPNVEMLGSKRSDIAFVPAWFFSAPEPDALIGETLNADEAIGVHVPARVPQALKDSGRDFFSAEGQERVIAPEGG